MLLLGVEPGTRIEERSNQDRYDQLWELLESCRLAGTLQGTDEFSDQIEPSKFVEWAE